MFYICSSKLTVWCSSTQRENCESTKPLAVRSLSWLLALLSNDWQSHQLRPSERSLGGLHVYRLRHCLGLCVHPWPSKHRHYPSDWSVAGNDVDWSLNLHLRLGFHQAIHPQDALPCHLRLHRLGGGWDHGLLVDIYADLAKLEASDWCSRLLLRRIHH